MTDQWTEKLQCPKCRKVGMAGLFQPDDQDKPTIDSLPEGFKVIETEHGIDFHCETCGVAAAP
jgi:predicted RNA-binding Zn-ribbon protein involved in translation (DUF1610 family)